MSSALTSHASSPAASLATPPMSEIAQYPRPSGRTSAAAPPTGADDIAANAAGASTDTEPLPMAILQGAVDKQSVAYLWRSGVAGGIAGCVAKSVVAPLDRVKILFQTSNQQFAKFSGSWAGVAQTMRIIYRQDGVLGLYQGHSATLLRVFPYAGVKFLAYEQIRSYVIPRREHETPLRRLLSGSLAGVTSVFITYPLEVVRVRLAFETRRDASSTLLALCRRIYREKPASAGGAAAAADTGVPPRPGGIPNFYRGFSPTVLGMLPYAGMSFLTHDTCGDLLRHPLLAPWTTLPQPVGAPAGKPPPLRSWAELLAGGIAGVVSQTASYPLEVIRRRMQVGGAVGDGHRLRLAETARQILREHGLRGFFVGLTIGYAKVMPMAAASFYTYERMKTYLGI